MTGNAPKTNRLYRSREDSIFFGVCGGLGEHFDVSPWSVRIGVILVMLFTAFIPVTVVYIILGLTLKVAPERVYENTEEEEFWDLYRHSRSAALRKIQRRFQTLDKRLQRLESIVTSPAYKFDEEYRKL